MSYQRISPDYAHVVRDVAARFPQLWEAARERPDGSRDHGFIKRLAWELHKIDPNIGLNGKRGSLVLSADALAYKNYSAPGGAEVIDVIVGADHSPTWQDVTIPPSLEHPQGVAGRFIQPERPEGEPEQGKPPAEQPERPTEPATPVCACNIDAAMELLEALRNDIALGRDEARQGFAEVKAAQQKSVTDLLKQLPSLLGWGSLFRRG